MFLVVTTLLLILASLYFLIIKPVYLAVKFKYSPDYIVVKNTWGDGSESYSVKAKYSPDYTYMNWGNFKTEQEAKDEVARLVKRDLACKVIKSEVLK